MRNYKSRIHIDPRLPRARGTRKIFIKITLGHAGVGDGGKGTRKRNLAGSRRGEGEKTLFSLRPDRTDATEFSAANCVINLAALITRVCKARATNADTCSSTSSTRSRNASRLYSAGKSNRNTNHDGRYPPAVALYCH